MLVAEWLIFINEEETIIISKYEELKGVIQAKATSCCRFKTQEGLPVKKIYRQSLFLCLNA